MSPEAHRLVRIRRLRELMVRRAAIRKEIHVLDTKIAALSTLSIYRRTPIGSPLLAEV